MTFSIETKYSELIDIEKELRKLSPRLSVLKRHIALYGKHTKWGATKCYGDSLGDPARFNALISRAAVLADLPGAGTLRERFLDGLLMYLIKENDARIHVSEAKKGVPFASEILAAPAVSANYVQNLVALIHSQTVDNQSPKAGTVQKFKSKRTKREPSALSRYWWWECSKAKVLLPNGRLSLAGENRKKLLDYLYDNNRPFPPHHVDWESGGHAFRNWIDVFNNTTLFERFSKWLYGEVNQSCLPWLKEKAGRRIKRGSNVPIED